MIDMEVTLKVFNEAIIEELLFEHDPNISDEVKKLVIENCNKTGNPFDAIAFYKIITRLTKVDE